jgi:hypothetical protein
MIGKRCCVVIEYALSSQRLSNWSGLDVSNQSWGSNIASGNYQFHCDSRERGSSYNHGTIIDNEES